MDESKGKQLIESLLRDPGQFAEDSGVNQLLEEYLNGLSVETLRPLLRHKDPWVYSAAVAITSEMSANASCLIDDIVPLVKDDNLWVRSDALKSVMMFTFYVNFDRFIHIIAALEQDLDNRSQIMRMVSNANEGQLSAALYNFEFKTQYEQQHKAGLSFLLQDRQSVSDLKVTQMILSDEPIVRIYGAIAMRRFFRFSLDYVKQFLSSDDEYVRVFAQTIINSWENVKSLPEDSRWEIW